jgi:hypothetical protein
MMRGRERFPIAAAVVTLTLAGPASAIPLTWTKTFTLTGTGANVPNTATETPGTLWLYAPSSNASNMGNPAGELNFNLGASGPTLDPTNPDNGNPVEYTLDQIVIEGTATSLIIGAIGTPEAGFGIDRLTDIRGTITQVSGAAYSYFPFDGVGLGCGSDPTGKRIYDTADLSTGDWTGFCPGSNAITPLDIGSIVTDATQFDLFFWNETDQAGDEPEARIDGMTIKLLGRCTGNCETGVVPAPAPLALLGLGVAGIAYQRHRRLKV